MLVMNFFKSFYNDLNSFLIDAKHFFIDIISYIHEFLNKFMSDDVITVFLIAIGAFVLILIFRAVINKR